MGQNEQPATSLDVDAVGPGRDESGPGTTPHAPDPDASGPPTASGFQAASPPAASSQAASSASSRWRTGLLRRRNLVVAGLVAVVAAGAFVVAMSWQVWQERNVHLSAPERVAGLSLDRSDGTQESLDYLLTAIKTEVELKSTTGAVYVDGSAEPRSVVFLGGTGALSAPDAALDKAFGLIVDEAGGVESVRDVPPGPLGGVMKCGTTRTDEGAMAVCGWADYGSLGVGMFPQRSVDESAGLLRTMRESMQHRG